MKTQQEKKLRENNSDTQYHFVVFKLKGLDMWRFNNQPHAPKDVREENITEIRHIKIDRITGELTYK